MYSVAKCLIRCAIALAGSVSPIVAASYFVSTSGSDSSPGTIDRPFQKIQKAADVAVAGDTVFIRGGVYRESVTPKNSGGLNALITYMPYNGETVTVSGADVIDPASWTPYNGSISQAPISWDLGEGRNQVFVDGQMMIEARWPNTTLDLSRPTLAAIAGGSYIDGGTGLSTGTITDPNLPTRPPGYWNSATIHILLGESWWWQTGPVIDSQKAQLSFNFFLVGNTLVPRAQNTYYLSGKPGELDSAGEWFWDSSQGALSLWTPGSDNPQQHVVEAKRRQLAFDLSGRSFISIQGLNIFAATITSNQNSQYLVLDGLTVQYISHSLWYPGRYPAGAELPQTSTGIILRGSNNVLRNSTLAWSAGNGLIVDGNGHRVFNNEIHDVAYGPGQETTAIFSGYDPSLGVLIGWNSIYNTSRAGIFVDPFAKGNFIRGRVLHNDIHDFGLQTNDIGGIYTSRSDGKSSEIAYNLFHDGYGLLLPPNSQTYVAGIYLDGGSSNYQVHHNAVWNTQWALHLNNPSTHNKVYNNTLVGIGSSLLPYGDNHTEGTEIRNNIFVGQMRPNLIGAVLSNNILPNMDPQFVDPASQNFQLKPTSPAIGTGIPIPGITDEFSGAAPDIGAYDHTKPGWKAGVQAAAYTVSAPDGLPGLIAGGSALVTGTTLFDSNARVLFTDGSGADLAANVRFVSPSAAQLTFEVPTNAALGVAMITITNGDGTISLSSASVFPAVQPRVLFDETHSEASSINLDRAAQVNPQNPTWQYLGALAAQMNGAGYRISRLTSGSLTPDALSQTDVLVLAAPGTSMTAAETQAVKAFVENGGGLIFIGSCCSALSINTLLSPWGISLDHRIIYSPSTGVPGFQVQNYPSHPALPPSPSFFISNGGGSLNVSGNAVALALTTEAEWKSISAKSTQQAGDPNGPFAILAAAQAGKGRVFASGNESFTDISRDGNRQIFLAALRWLTAGLYPTPSAGK